jgi:hypothetical protein
LEGRSDLETWIRIDHGESAGHLKLWVITGCQAIVGEMPNK